MNLYQNPSLFLESPLASLALEEKLAQNAPLRWGSDLWDLAKGRLTEVSGAGGGGGLTLAASFVRRAQSRQQSVLWLTSEVKPFYPPDMQAAGVDLQRLPLLFFSKISEASTVATRLLSSGGFDLLIWDLASWKRPPRTLPVPFLARLQGLARHHRATVLLLTQKEADDVSLGCLIGLRLQVEAHSQVPALLEVRVVKDKRGAVGEGKEWSWRCRLPDGLPAFSSLPSAMVVPSASRMAG